MARLPRENVDFLLWLVLHRWVIRSSQLHLIPPDGNIPSGKSSLLYKWRVLLANNSAVDYITSVPLMQTDEFEKEGTLNVSVVVSNKGEIFPPPPPLARSNTSSLKIPLGVTLIRLILARREKFI
ncbi:hypothetical protein TNCV_2616111 [Trichonephila clavipes]|nr:hypothetical protein TNCV_2616111 [Trichonephila clavipes]